MKQLWKKNQNLQCLLKPDILMESTSHNEEEIEKEREYMKSINGKVVVIPYYPSQSSTEIKNRIKK